MRLVIELPDQEAEEFKQIARAEGLSYKELIERYIVNLSIPSESQIGEIERSYLGGLGFKAIAKEIKRSRYFVFKQIKVLLKNHPEYLELHTQAMPKRYLKSKVHGRMKKAENRNKRVADG